MNSLTIRDRKWRARAGAGIVESTGPRQRFFDMRRAIDPNQLGEDWLGNNVAVTCPLCNKVFVVIADAQAAPSHQQGENA